jgi:multicomponent Na+:H+ antiporter subunit A
MPQFVTEIGPGMLVPALLPALLGLLLGPAVVWLHPLIGAAGSAAAGQPYNATFALFGGFTAELGLSITIIVLGLVVISQRRVLDRVFERRIFSFTAIDVVERVRTSLMSAGARVGDVARTDRQMVHLGTPWILLGLLALAAVLMAPTVGDVIQPGEPWTDALMLALLVVTVVPAVLTRSRLTALILVGGAGFAVALWFFALGAIDVGLTQLLVELLTVVALVLILRRLPAVFHRVARSRQAVTAVIALGAGVAATLVTLAFTGRRGISDVGQYFLDEAYVDTGGTNVVNTILVDYRALDTLGELTVVAIAGIVLMGVLAGRPILAERTPDLTAWSGTALLREVDNTLPIRVIARWAAPVVIVLSLYLLLRGHYEPGGGFISALVGGTGFALAYLGAPSDRSAPVRWPYRALLSAGVVVGVASGIGGYLVGSFLRPVRFDILLPWGGEYGFTSALIFDLGVYFAVVAVIIAVINELGGVREKPGELTGRARLRVKEGVR